MTSSPTIGLNGTATNSGVPRVLSKRLTGKNRHNQIAASAPNDSEARPERLGAQWIGPGLIMAASGIGASDIISATVGGATHGVALLWALALGAFLKFVLSEGLARWQLATGETLVEGWAHYLPRWVLCLFTGYLVLWGVAVSGALVSGCGLALENITNGVIHRSWGGLIHAIIAFGFIYAARTRGFARLMKPLIAIMFFSLIACAALTYREPVAALKGLLIPSLPANGGIYVLSLIGGIGGSVTLLSYNYLLRDESATFRTLRGVRWDLATAYGFTALFGTAVMLIASRVFHAANVAITDRRAVAYMAEHLAEVAGPVGFYVYSLGFWAAVVASLVGVWEIVPRIFGDCYGLLRRLPEHERTAVMHGSSWQSRTALAFMAVASLPFAFVGRPLLVIVAFTIVGSLFIPFLAATLLYMNNRVQWPAAIGHNSAGANAMLVLVLVVFVAVACQEVGRLF